MVCVLTKYDQLFEPSKICGSPFSFFKLITEKRNRWKKKIEFTFTIVIFHVKEDDPRVAYKALSPLQELDPFRDGVQIDLI